MKALYQDLPFPKDSFINFYKEELPHFIVPWHYHPEIEIMHISEGYGTRFVGDSIDSYRCGDICMIGPGLQHEWRNDPVFFRDNEGLKARCNVVFFRKEVFEDKMIYLSEMANVRELIERCQRGIMFYGKSRDRIEAKINEIHSATGIGRITGLIELLALMAGEKEYRLLASERFINSVRSKDFNRFNKVYEYLVTNYTKKITLSEIAAIAGLTPQAFCHYFKSKTGMTFTKYLNSMRIAHAKRLLIEGHSKISVVVNETGFNNMSHFIEQFKAYAGLLPGEFQEKYGSRNVDNMQQR